MIEFINNIYSKINALVVVSRDEVLALNAGKLYSLLHEFQSILFYIEKIESNPSDSTKEAALNLITLSKRMIGDKIKNIDWIQFDRSLYNSIDQSDYPNDYSIIHLFLIRKIEMLNNLIEDEDDQRLQMKELMTSTNWQW